MVRTTDSLLILPDVAVGDELGLGSPLQQEDDNQLRVLTLEEEVAQLRPQIHRLQAELSRQRRMQRQQQELNQLSQGHIGSVTYGASGAERRRNGDTG